MRVLTPKEMAACDQDTIEAGFPEILLMEAAAYKTAEIAEEMILADDLLARKEKKDLKILLMVGKGNNGGDGLAAARILKNKGYQPEIILAASPENLKAVNQKNFKLAQLTQVTYHEFSQLAEDEFIKLVKNSDLMIDALLGTGIKGSLRGNIKEMISLVKAHKKVNSLVLAVDIPSGVNGRDGSLAGTVLKADQTVTMAAYKRGLLLYPGREYAGKIRVAEIGIPAETIAKNSQKIEVFEQKKAAELLPDRLSFGHKGTFGKAAVLAGSRGMTGAPLLTSKAVLSSGAGLVYLLTAAEIEQITTAQQEEVIGIPLASKDGIISGTALAEIIEAVKKVDLLAAGPGLSQSAGVKKIISGILTNLELPLILDADGINAVDDLKDLKNYPGELVLTPHPGELARLIDKDIKEINENRIEIARNFAQKYQLNLVLKGATTVTAAQDGRIFLNSSGCNGMAAAGSGDVLTGMITALMAQKLKGFEAAALAVYVHGKAGESAAEQKSNFALMAGDIIDNLGTVWKKIQNAKRRKR